MSHTVPKGLEDTAGGNIPAFRPAKGSEYSFTFDTTSKRNPNPITHELVRVYLTNDAYAKLGPAGVDVSSGSYDMVIPKNAYVDIQMDGRTHIALMQVSASGAAYINGWE